MGAKGSYKYGTTVELHDRPFKWLRNYSAAKMPKLNFLIQNPPYFYPITTLTQDLEGFCTLKCFPSLFSCLIHQALEFLKCPILLLYLLSSHKQDEESWRTLLSGAICQSGLSEWSGTSLVSFTKA